MKKEKRRKVYLIGIDSAPLWVIKALASHEEFAPFKRFMEKGKIVELESTMPPMTGPAWPSIYTGLKPSEHGVPDFFVMKEEYVPDLVYYDSQRFPPFWEKLAEQGVKSLIITPATDVNLSRRNNVDMISGFPLKAKSNRKNIDALMDKHGFHGEPDIESDMKSNKISVDEGAREFAKSVRARADIAKELIEKGSYDFVYVCFTETDRMQHATLNRVDHMEYLKKVYSGISEFLGFVMARASDENGTVLLVSDHGAQPVTSKFLINAMLADEGFITFRGAVSGNNESATPNKKDSFRYVIREKLLTTRLRRVYDKLPHRVKGKIFRLFSAATSNASGEEYTHVHLMDMDMHKTKAFAAISNLTVGTIWINDSRFKSGIVKNGEKRELKKEIMRSLSHQKCPDGKRLFTDIIDAEKYYGRKTSFIAPDIMFEAREGYIVDVKYYSKNSRFMKPELFKSGDHTKFGIFGAYPNATQLQSMKVTDVAKFITELYAKR